MIIAIDGPAASGKGTLGKRLAAHYGLRHLDTGLLYRAVAKAMIDGGSSPRRHDARAVAAAQALDLPRFDEPALKSHASRRGGLAGLGHSRRCAPRCWPSSASFGRAPPGAVLDGRDIGTVIFPDAEVEDLSSPRAPEMRARRRAVELAAGGEAISEAEILADIRAPGRARHRQRGRAPSRPAPDAHLLDTTHLDIDAAFRAAVDIVEAVRAGRKRG